MSLPRTTNFSVSLQERDLALLLQLFESRVMTLAHATALIYDGHLQYATKRLQKLKAAGLIAARPREQFERAVLSLAQGGLLELKSRGLLKQFPDRSLAWFEKRATVSDRTIEHELAVMDVKVALSTAISRRRDHSVIEFLTWPLLCEFTVHGVTQKPDGYVHVRVIASDEDIVEHRFFLEVDRSTESLRTLVTKAARYRAYYRSGSFASRQRNGTAGNFGFRALFVLESEERRQNLAHALLRELPPILRQVWLTTADELQIDPLGAIWTRPSDYREAARAFDASRSAVAPYRRDTDRISSLLGKVRSHTLFAAGGSDSQSGDAVETRVPERR